MIDAAHGFGEPGSHPHVFHQMVNPHVDRLLLLEQTQDLIDQSVCIVTEPLRVIDQPRDIRLEHLAAERAFRVCLGELPLVDQRGEPVVDVRQEAHRHGSSERIPWVSRAEHPCALGQLLDVRRFVVRVLHSVDCQLRQFGRNVTLAGHVFPPECRYCTRPRSLRKRLSDDREKQVPCAIDLVIALVFTNAQVLFDPGVGRLLRVIFTEAQAHGDGLVRATIHQGKGATGECVAHVLAAGFGVVDLALDLVMNEPLNLMEERLVVIVANAPLIDGGSQCEIWVLFFVHRLQGRFDASLRLNVLPHFD